jgi:hypothetical protein
MAVGAGARIGSVSINAGGIVKKPKISGLFGENGGYQLSRKSP